MLGFVYDDRTTAIYPGTIPRLCVAVCFVKCFTNVFVGKTFYKILQRILQSKENIFSLTNVLQKNIVSA